jgi:hypothetical protein
VTGASASRARKGNAGKGNGGKGNAGETCEARPEAWIVVYDAREVGSHFSLPRLGARTWATFSWMRPRPEDSLMVRRMATA